MPSCHASTARTSRPTQTCRSRPPRLELVETTAGSAPSPGCGGLDRLDRRLSAPVPTPASLIARPPVPRPRAWWCATRSAGSAADGRPRAAAAAGAVGPPASWRSARPSAAGSSGRTSSPGWLPSSPRPSASGTPPTAVAITGTPWASASVTTIPYVSAWVARTSASAPAYAARTSSWSHAPANTTRSAIPVSAAVVRSSSTNSGSRSRVPTSVQRQSRSRSPARAASSTSWPLARDTAATQSSSPPASVPGTGSAMSTPGTATCRRVWSRRYCSTSQRRVQDRSRRARRARRDPARLLRATAAAARAGGSGRRAVGEGQAAPGRAGCAPRALRRRTTPSNGARRARRRRTPWAVRPVRGAAAPRTGLSCTCWADARSSRVPTARGRRRRRAIRTALRRCSRGRAPSRSASPT